MLVNFINVMDCFKLHSFDVCCFYWITVTIYYSNFKRGNENKRGGFKNFTVLEL